MVAIQLNLADLAAYITPRHTTPHIELDPNAEQRNEKIK